MKVRCLECGKTADLRPPLSRVLYVLSSLTICPSGGIHPSLPSARENTLIEGEEK